MDPKMQVSSETIICVHFVDGKMTLPDCKKKLVIFKQFDIQDLFDLYVGRYLQVDPAE